MSGAWRETGQTTAFEVFAATEDDARAQATAKGLLIERVEAVTDGRRRGPADPFARLLLLLVLLANLGLLALVWMIAAKLGAVPAIG